MLPRLPSRCAVCRSWPSAPLCEACVAAFAQPRPRCQRCALPLAAATRAAPATVCGACLLHPPPLDACHAALPYSFPWSGLISAYKFHAQTGWARHLADLMRSQPWIEPALEQADWVLPLPLSAQRLRARGYNQAWELACALLPRTQRGKLRADLLLRIADTAPQPGLARAERVRNVARAFAVQPLRAPLLQGRRVVVVDDVMTSGASLYSAATCLRQAGAAHITGLVLARADNPDPGDDHILDNRD